MNSTSSSDTAGSMASSRISLSVFNGVTWTFYAIAVSMALLRTGFRVYTFRRIDLDDGFLIFAIFTMTAAFTLGHFLLPIAFIQNDLGLGRLSPADIPDFSEQMFLEKNVETAASAMVWVTIYAVKYSYMFFFKKLVSRVRRLQIWWWCVMGILIPVSLIGSLFDFSICPVFTPNFLQKCPVEQLIDRETTWLVVTTVLDIITDVLIISIPAMLIWNVKIPLRAKLGLGLALCLSTFMVCAAIIRISLGFLPSGTTDTPWIYFCFLIEDATAVFMVSTTAFRSTFGHHNKNSTKGSLQSRNKKHSIRMVNVDSDGSTDTARSQRLGTAQKWEIHPRNPLSSHSELVPGTEYQASEEGRQWRGEELSRRNMV